MEGKEGREGCLCSKGLEYQLGDGLGRVLRLVLDRGGFE